MINKFPVGLSTANALKSLGLSCEYLPEIASTNDYGKELVFEEKFRYVIAENQTKGRGRKTNSWKSAAEDQLNLTLVGQALPKKVHPHFSIRVGFTLLKLLREHFDGVDFLLKAPNDIYVGKKKLAGVLIEWVATGEDLRLVLGIGLNVFSSPNLNRDGDAETICLMETQTAQAKTHFESRWQSFVQELSVWLKLDADHPDKALTAELETAAVESINAFVTQFSHDLGALIKISPSGELIFKNKTIEWDKLGAELS